MTNSDVRKILVAEDDRAVRESLEIALQLEGYEIVLARDGRAALAAVDEHEPDALVLDVGLPFLDGFTVARTIRADGSDLPILMLTARDTVGDRVTGLDAGADDYLAKPFALDELFARVRALLRRTSVVAATSATSLGDVSLDPTSRKAARAGRDLVLTRTEFDLLELFLHNAGIVMSRETIYERIWDYDFDPSSKSLDVHVSYLRRKLELDGDSRILSTIRGIGYLLEKP